MPALTRAAARPLIADAVAGFVVFLIALPLCLGIAHASGVPPAAGVLTAIVGGAIGTLLGGAPLTIKGPAAGLIVITLGAVTELGMGDPQLGYRRALAVGVVAALVQIALAVSRSGILASVMPPAVVHGMLAAIGVIIVAKQAPVMLGVEGARGEPLEMLLHLPRYILEANPEVVLVGALALAVLIAAPRIPLVRRIPAPMIALAGTVPLAFALHFERPHTYEVLGHTYALGPSLLVDLPASLLDILVVPDFSMIASATSIKYVVMFALVGSVESLLSVLAVDALDPARRATNLNRDLLAIGVGNLVASAIGGLPMISEIVRSKANLDAGATSARANLFHGLFLLGFVALLPGLLERIPLAALAAMLVYTGLRLASPREFRHAWDIGRDQFLLFAATFAVTLAVDLLAGVGVGVALKIALHAWRSGVVAALFRGSVAARREGPVLTIAVRGPAVFTNLIQLRRALAAVDATVEVVVLDLTRATLIDHTVLETVRLAAGEWERAELRIVGLDDMRPSSRHPLASRRRVA
jgi:MFS superfamily sulfate permease-like transporter